jgi:hypothetical protein
MSEKQNNTPETPEEPMRPIEEAVSELERELLVRKRCYGRWVDDGKLSRVDAIDRYARLQSALCYLREAAADGDPSAPPGPLPPPENVPF